MQTLARVILFLCLSWVVDVGASALPEEAPDWRQQALDAVREGAEAQLATADAVTTGTDAAWSISGRLYLAGRLIAHEAAIGATLEAAARRVGARVATAVPPESLRAGRFFLTVESHRASGSLVEYKGRALEVVGDVTVVDSVDRERILATVRAQREYLLRQVDPTHHAFFKVYSARQDRRQERLRVTYTASALWTLLQMRDLEPDPRIDALIEPVAGFLLSMQVAEGEHAGAFHYSFDPRTGKRRDRFVVGTVSKTIFTLLELHRRTQEARYLESARRAGDWLLTRVDPDGKVMPVTTRGLASGEWNTITKQSVLYSAETLSALSQLARVTGKRAYRRAATAIADRLIEQGELSQYVYGDDFRRPNTVSTSWVAMALLDYTAVVPDPRAERTLFAVAHQVRSRQVVKPLNLLDHGRYFDIWASSGNGWMNEVLVPVYERCIATGQPRCELFRAALDRTARWLIQNTYSHENSFHIPNPERALGGAIRDAKVEQVRTDAVCHAANSLIGMLKLPQG